MNLRIVISGKTAAGKTTHGKLVAKRLGLPYYSAIDVFARLLRRRTGADWLSRWSTGLDQERTSNSRLDDEVDDEVIRTVTTVDSGLFDFCLLPWLLPTGETLNVWIESDEASRIRKCIVSHLDENLTAAQARKIVCQKDAVSAARLLSARGANFEPNQDIFGLVITNSSLIPEATNEAAKVGIAAFQPVLDGALDYISGITSRNPNSSWIKHIRRSSRARNG